MKSIVESSKIRKLLFISSCVFGLGCNEALEKHDQLMMESREEAPDFIQFDFLRRVNPNTGELPSEKRYNFLPSTMYFGLMRGERLDKKTRIFPNTWVPVNDFFASLAVSKIDYNPLNPQERYFCTGEGWFNADAARGAGIWKSSDAGKSWNRLESTRTDTFYYCQDLRVHPQTGHVYVCTREGGLQRSTDGGNSFHPVLSSANGSRSNRAADLEIDSEGGIWVSFGMFNTDGIYYSQNGNPGTWELRINGLPGNMHRIEIAVAASNPDRLFCIPTDATDRKISGVYRSDDRGLNWKEVSLPGNDRELAALQGWYDLIIQVDPNNEDVAVAGGLNLYRTRDGGTTWQQLCEGRLRLKSPLQYVHVDQHDVYFASSDLVFFMNDGGIYRCDSFTADSPLIYQINQNYNVTQYYSAAMYPGANDFRILGGTQDNGSQRSTGSGISDFEQLSWADGSFCEVNPKSLAVFTTTQFRRIYRFHNNKSDTLSNPNLVDNNTLFINPLHLDPSDPEILYQPSNRGLWRLKNASTSDSTQWEQACAPTGQISALGLSQNIPHVAFMGLSQNGLVYRLENCHRSNAQSRTVFIDEQRDLPRAYVSSIAVDPTDANHVVVVFSNYGVDKVFESTNAMSDKPRWRRCDGNYPDLPVLWVLLHPDRPGECYLGSELGVYYTDALNGDQTVWKQSNQGLANLRMDMIRFRKSDNVFVVGSHGRGIYTGKNMSGSNEIFWEERGPSNVGGRTRTIMREPLDPSGKKYWTGSVSGGLWYVNNIDSVAVFEEKSPQNDQVSWRVYPNPVNNDRIVLEQVSGATEVKQRSFVLYSLLGQELIRTELGQGSKHELNIPQVRAGYYVFALYEGDKLVMVKKLLVN